jgi:hypothetical protein
MLQPPFNDAQGKESGRKISTHIKVSTASIS